MERWRRVNGAVPEDARALLGACCGASRWVEGMMRRRPFATLEHALSAAEEEWWALGPDDWREAFSHHPKIGDVEALRVRFPTTHQLSSAEQAGIAGAPDAVLTALAEGNRAYEQKFGYIFIVCATGKRAEEILALLNARIGNAPDVEIKIAAAEQARISAIRLQA
jgi:2-oxo-4-hydroxy-4-carboxy-5-ureidoimidazoline decarboxylase